MSQFGEFYIHLLYCYEYITYTDVLHTIIHIYLLKADVNGNKILILYESFYFPTLFHL